MKFLPKINLRRRRKKRKRGYWDGMPEEYMRAEYQREWKSMRDAKHYGKF